MGRGCFCPNTDISHCCLKSVSQEIRKYITNTLSMVMKVTSRHSQESYKRFSWRNWNGIRREKWSVSLGFHHKLFHGIWFLDVHILITFIEKKMKEMKVEKSHCSDWGWGVHTFIYFTGQFFPHSPPSLQRKWHKTTCKTHPKGCTFGQVPQ